MRHQRTSRLRRFMTAVLLTGVGLGFAVAGASNASAATGGGATTNALAFDVNGLWTDNGSAKPVFTVVNNTVVIDMSFAHRPNATGSVISATSILVTFPDADTYIGTFQTPGFLRWSNGATWQKVYTGPTVIDLNTTWTDGQTRHHITQVNGLLTVNMAESHRPNGVGFAVNATTIQVTFPGDGTYSATLQAPDFVTWSNGSQWREWVDTSPGNPQCLVATILC
jgi:hypothetical protein